MPYVENRVVHDADSHLMELSDCLDAFLDPKFRAAYDELPKLKAWPRDGKLPKWANAQQDDAQFRAGADANILLRKNYEALGAFRKQDRPRALDLLGFSSQLIFTTWCLGNFGLDDVNPELAYATAEAHNRMMADFCSVDRRFLGTAYVPLADAGQTLDTAREAIALGLKALLIPSRCPKGHSPSHVDFEPLWAMAQDAGLPIVFHVGGEEKLNPDYFNNGLPRVKDFHGGEENFTSVSYMPIPHSVMTSLAALIFDGVLDRHPRLKFGAIELGASWLPGWMRNMDSAAQAFIKNEERLQKLSARPSEIVRRQVRVTPYPHEDTGWIIANSGEEVCLFSSDFPHVEGGRNPLKRFGDSLASTPARAVERFYRDNFIDLMGSGLASDLRRARGVGRRLTVKYDAIVLGLGAFGSATVYRFAKRGARVLGIDQFAPPHEAGSTHGDTRITRLANGENALFTGFVRRSHEIWREIERESGESLLTQCGGLVISGASKASVHVEGFFENTVANARANAVAHEILSASDIRRRFPQFNVRDDETGYFEPEMGFVRPEACVRAQLGLAQARGAELRLGEQLLEFQASDEGVEVRTDRGTYRADAAVVALGAWLPEVCPQLQPLLKIYRQTLFWFDIEGDTAPYEPGRFPIFIWELPDSHAGIYGFPVIAPRDGVKVASEQYAQTTTPQAVRRDVSPQEIAAMHRLIAPFLPKVSGRCLKSATCLYTVTPDSQFIIDRLPGAGRVVVASPCSGHGFKHSPAIAEALADLALEGRSRLDLAPFRLARFG